MRVGPISGVSGVVYVRATPGGSRPFVAFRGAKVVAGGEASTAERTAAWTCGRLSRTCGGAHKAAKNASMATKARHESLIFQEMAGLGSMSD